MPDVLQPYPLEEVLRTAIALLVVFSGLITVMFVIWGGFLMIVSGWNEEKVKAAVNHIRHAFIGVLLIIAVLYAGPIFFGLFGLPYGEYMRPSAVFDQIGSLSNRLLGQPVETPPLGIENNSSLPADFTDF